MAHHFVLSVLVCGFIALLLVTDSSSLAGSSQSKIQLNLTWSANISEMYPPSSPLTVELGTKLFITCPPDASSNIWIQTLLEQYEQCKCEVNTDDPSLITFCDPMDATVKHICFDEAIIEVKSGSLNLDSALEFEADTTYYLTSYSPGMPQDGFMLNSSGGQCLEGFRMSMYVAPVEFPTTTSQAITVYTALADTENPSTATAELETTTSSDPSVTDQGNSAFDELPFTNFTSGTVSLVTNNNKLNILLLTVCFLFLFV